MPPRVRKAVVVRSSDSEDEPSFTPARLGFRRNRSHTVAESDSDSSSDSGAAEEGKESEVTTPRISEVRGARLRPARGTKGIDNSASRACRRSGADVVKNRRIQPLRNAGSTTPSSKRRRSVRLQSREERRRSRVRRRSGHLSSPQQSRSDGSSEEYSPSPGSDFCPDRTDAVAHRAAPLRQWSFSRHVVATGPACTTRLVMEGNRYNREAREELCMQDDLDDFIVSDDHLSNSDSSSSVEPSGSPPRDRSTDESESDGELEFGCEPSPMVENKRHESPGGKVRAKTMAKRRSLVPRQASKRRLEAQSVRLAYRRAFSSKAQSTSGVGDAHGRIGRGSVESKNLNLMDGIELSIRTASNEGGLPVSGSDYVQQLSNSCVDDSTDEDDFLATDDDDEGIGSDPSNLSHAADDKADPDVVDCPCGATADLGYQGVWVRCSNELCQKWQHARCVGLGASDKIPKKYLCFRCQALISEDQRNLLGHEYGLPEEQRSQHRRGRLRRLDSVGSASSDLFRPPGKKTQSKEEEDEEEAATAPAGTSILSAGPSERLYLAVRDSNALEAKHAIAAGADIGWVNPRDGGRTVLMQCMAEGAEAVLALLFDAASGISPSVSSTPSSRTRRRRIIEEEEDSFDDHHGDGKSIQKSDMGEASAHIACALQSRNSSASSEVKHSLSSANVPPMSSEALHKLELLLVDAHGYNVLHHGCKAGASACVQALLLRLPADIAMELLFGEDVEGSTPLDLSLMYNHPSTSRLLIDIYRGKRKMNGEKSCVPDSAKQARGLLTLDSDNEGNACKELIQNLADKINASNLLLSAAEGGSTVCCQQVVAFLKEKTDPVPNKGIARPKQGTPDRSRLSSEWTHGDVTPLMVAAAHCSGDGVREIAGWMESSAWQAPDPAVYLKQALTCEDSSGANAMHYAAGAGNIEALDALLDICNQVERSTSLSKAKHRAGQGYPASAGTSAQRLDALLLRLGDRQGATPLHCAAMNGHTEMVRRLLDAGCSAAVQDATGWPPLLYADFTAKKECVLSLLDRQQEEQISLLGELFGDMSGTVRSQESAAGVEEEEEEFKGGDGLEDTGTLSVQCRKRTRVLHILKYLATVPAYYDVVNKFLQDRLELLDGACAFLLHIRGLVNFSNRRQWMRRQIEDMFRSHFRFRSMAKEIAKPAGSVVPEHHQRQHGHEAEADDEDERDVEALLPRFGPKELKIVVRRSFAWQQLCTILQDRALSVLRRPMKVSFQEAPEFSAPGIKREYMDILAHEMTRSPEGLFETWPERDGGRFYYPVPASGLIDRKREFEVAGAVFGHALAHDHILGIQLSPSFIKLVLQTKQLDLDDLARCDPELERNFRWLLSCSQEDLESLDLTFTCEEDEERIPVEAPGTGPTSPQAKGRRTVIELIPDGHNTAVTVDNRDQYIQLMVQRVLVERNLVASMNFRSGLSKVVPPAIWTVFSEDELALVFNGVGEIDLLDWKDHTQYSGGYSIVSDQIAWFWQVVEESMNAEERSLLLKFATGSSSVPIGGFANLKGFGIEKHPFTVSRDSEDVAEKLPRAATCFNTIYLPPYPTFDVLEAKLLTAVRLGCEGFSFA